MLSFWNSNYHIHFEVMIGGNSIGLAGLAQDVWQMGVVASDRVGFNRAVTWHQEITSATQYGFWANDDEKVIFFRDALISDNTSTDYFLAWEDGKEIEEMTRVVWDTQESNWVSMDTGKVWNGSIFE